MYWNDGEGNLVQKHCIKHNVLRNGDRERYIEGDGDLYILFTNGDVMDFDSIGREFGIITVCTS